jgi:hypothetical protein
LEKAMENMMPGVGGEAVDRHLGVRVAMAMVAVGLVITAMVVFQRPAHAQIGFGNFLAFICQLLQSLAASLGGFLRPIINAIAAAFGCGTISGG